MLYHKLLGNAFCSLSLHISPPPSHSCQSSSTGRWSPSPPCLPCIPRLQCPTAVVNNGHAHTRFLCKNSLCLAMHHMPDLLEQELSRQQHERMKHAMVMVAWWLHGAPFPHTYTLTCKTLCRQFLTGVAQMYCSTSLQVFMPRSIDVACLPAGMKGLEQRQEAQLS